jgi:hypothetical protein
VRRSLAGMILGLTILAAGCSPAASGPDTESNAQMARTLDGLAAAASAERLGDVTWYDAENLHEFVGGLAEYYVEAGFVRVAHSEWRAAGQTGPAYVELDLYDMGSPLGALDVFADGRTVQSLYFDIGREARRTDTGLEMRAGRFFVRLSARKDITGQWDLVRSLAAAVVKDMPQAPADTALLSPLPAAGLVPHTATYQTKGFLGREFLQKVRAATYVSFGKPVQLFAMDAGSPEGAVAVMDEWRGYLPPAPIGESPMNSDRLTWNDPALGAITVTHRGRWVAGAIGDPASGKAALDAIIPRLE